MNSLERTSKYAWQECLGRWQGMFGALALALGGAELAEAACPTTSSGNYASVVQQSGSSGASGIIDQSGGGTGNAACADQDSTSPLATIVQIGSAGTASVDQSGGADQSAYVRQGGSGGSVTITQNQADGLVSNAPPLMQGLTAFTSLLSGAPHFNDVGHYSAVVVQASGSDNQASVLQDAGNNASYAEIGQLGSGNQAGITQGYLAQAALSANYASIVQQGNGNTAALSQTGSGLNGSISQTGGSYLANLTQTGSNLPDLAIAQNGGATYITVGGTGIAIPGTSVTVTQTEGGASTSP
jgi:hypothetical protein